MLQLYVNSPSPYVRDALLPGLQDPSVPGWEAYGHWVCSGQARPLFMLAADSSPEAVKHDGVYTSDLDPHNKQDNAAAFRQGIGTKWLAGCALWVSMQRHVYSSPRWRAGLCMRVCMPAFTTTM
jgi:hypothetical protein